MFKRKPKRDLDEVQRIIENLVEQKQSIWSQLAHNAAEAERRIEALKRERDESEQRYAAMQRDRDYFREQAGGNEP